MRTRSVANCYFTGPPEVAPAATRQRLADGLRRLGVRRGDTLLVHASLSSLKWVHGGAPAVVFALRRAVGAAGNVVAATGTEENSLTSRAHRAITAMMSPGELREYHATMPAFDRDATPSGMGTVSEALRNADGAVRSSHPQSSFAAVGPDAGYLMDDHRLDCHLGEDSPLAKLYKIDARILMIGVSYKVCTAFHLAEYRYTDTPPKQTYNCVLTARGGERRWESYQDVVLDDREFENIGRSLDKDDEVEHGYLGDARCRLLPLQMAVDGAADWLRGHRS